MYSAAVGGEGAVALQLREAAPGELDGARLHDDRLAIACHEPELLADLLHAAADIGKCIIDRFFSLTPVTRCEILHCIIHYCKK